MISGIDIADMLADNTKLIGLTGKAGSGKDTIADTLVQLGKFKKISFAEPIRDALRAMMGLKDAHFAHPLKEVVIPEFGKSPREMMQTLGTEWGRQLVHTDIWLLIAKKRIDEYRKEGYSVVIADVRFSNEAALIRNEGGEVWHVQRGIAGTPHAHISEAGVEKDPLDVIVDNNGGLMSLVDTVTKLVNR